MSEEGEAEIEIEESGDESATIPLPVIYSPSNDNDKSSSKTEAEHFVIPDWVSDQQQKLNMDADMDAQSRALIEQMLAEEEYYFGERPTIVTGESAKIVQDKQRKKDKLEKKSGKKIVTGEDGKKLSSVDLPSHNMRWTTEEDTRLFEALEKFGYGNWKPIAQMVGTRNPLQCKNHARHLKTVDPAVASKSPLNISTQEPRGTKRRRLSRASSENLPSSAQHVQAKVQNGSSPERDQPPKQSLSENTVSEQGDPKGTQEDSSVILPILKQDEVKEEEDEEEEVDIEMESDDGTPAQIPIPAEETVAFLTGKHEENTTTQGLSEGSRANQEVVVGNTRESNSPQMEIKQESTKIENAYDDNVDGGEEPPTAISNTITVPNIKREESPVADSPKKDAVQPAKSPDIMAETKSHLVTREKSIKELYPDDGGDDIFTTTFKEEMSEFMDMKIDLSTVSPEERRANPEWFCNRPPKTPERYVKIRNYILQMWAKSRPRYLTKTKIRPGLRDCGDVNAIGRVHTYLERIGAINVGCTVPAPRPPRRRPASAVSKAFYEEIDSGEGEDDPEARWSTVMEGPRKRRVRNEYGEWVDPKELEGRVITHNAEERDLADEELEEMYEQERLAAQNAKYFANGEIKVNTKIPRHKRAQYYLKRKAESNHYHPEGYDPFRLVPLRTYSPTQNPAPFHVTIHSESLALMDFHAHLATTEIIGLLGGIYDPDVRQLTVTAAFPCRSMSTGIQCEMDPASEMHAREVFAARGIRVVGWYHSHPTFVPDPSVRDIETQSTYQELFRRPEDAIEPFIGVIISPYDVNHPSSVSRVQYLSISHELDEEGHIRLPYACEKKIERMDRIEADLFKQILDLVKEYRSYEHRVDFNIPYRRGESETRLDKMLHSLGHHLYAPEDETRLFIDRVRELVHRAFNVVIEEPNPTFSEDKVTSENDHKEDILRPGEGEGMSGEDIKRE
ncbi:uncharacterized protein VTP21DRAFT_5158 [Calcarisporiella thermophila]|uniref:uncharacterized protein n=1 Tax=Calcarisporiella thermophila TaxID=911321 RepID=UPI003744546B